MRYLHVTSIAVVALLLSSGLSLAAARQGRSTVSGGVRIHAAQSNFEDLPFDNGDLSYGIGYEWHEATAYWQLLLCYAPHVSGTNDVDTVLTPQVNLIVNENAYHAGIGILRSYITREDDEDWTKVYWQMLLGLHFPFFGGGTIEGSAYYIFEGWDKMGFRTDDLDYGIWVSYPF